MHCRGHQRASTSIALGNSRADSEARKAASTPYRASVTAPVLPHAPDLVPTYSKEEKDFLQAEGGQVIEEGWIQLLDGRIAVPQLLGAAVILAVHETTHLGQESLEKLLGQYFYISHLSALAKTVAQQCVTFRQHNARQGPTIPASIQAYGAAPFEDLQVDFTEMPKCGGLDCPYKSAQTTGRHLWLTCYRRRQRYWGSHGNYIPPTDHRVPERWSG
ncbi:uncharacterized protein [Symphalangus syndactylus]|uniref:uncharacterized protein n=1 Tax=Symphalangus syndactylus TaxID=9590 RepID=UPI003003B1C4